MKLILGTVLCAVFLSGCVSMAGTAGYWNTTPEGTTAMKQASFDTNKLVQKDEAPGSVTV